MAPVENVVAKLAVRDFTCGAGYYLSGDICRPYSNWSYWGRWVFAGILLILFMLTLSALAARRRRRAGDNPFYGTGWMAPNHKYGESQQHQNTYYQPPPPRYSAAQPQYYNPPPTNGYFGNQEGIQLQQPPAAYNRGTDHVYEPPAGAPPAKN